VQHAIESVAADAPRVASVELVEACLLRPWPGNVRELLAELRAATLLAGDRAEILDSDLSERAGRELAPADPIAAPDGEQDPIAAALAAEGGNASRAAARLGISRSKVRRFIERQGGGSPRG
jgi:transcriptional regulator of acetoin/glycerol metabolism